MMPVTKQLLTKNVLNIILTVAAISLCKPGFTLYPPNDHVVETNR